MASLRVSGLGKSFGKTEVLSDVSFSLQQGEVLAIIGSSGGGKTTLLRCLNFLEAPDCGQICLDGELLCDAAEMKKLSADELRACRLHFGLVFQSFNLFPQYTALENVSLAPKLLGRGTSSEIEAKSRELLGRVGLSDKLGNYPCQLSGGQQQRVAIARALALQPDILCFDEPTSALDPELTREVLRVIRELADGSRTMIIVTHEMEFARSVADRVLFIADGRVEEEGTPEEIFGSPKSAALKNFLQNYAE